MKKFLVLTLVFILCLSCMPGVAAFGTTSPPGVHYFTIKNNNGSGEEISFVTIYGNNTGGGDSVVPDTDRPGPKDPGVGTGTDGEVVPGVAEQNVEAALYVEPTWKLVVDYNEEGEETVSAAAYLLPVSDDGVYEYAPGSWLLDQMLNKLDTFAFETRKIELSAGSSGPVSAPALAPYTGGEAGEPVYSSLFNLPAQDEGRTFPDDGITLVVKFHGGITVSVPAQQAASVLSAIDLKVYSDRLVLELAGAEDAEAYIEVPCTGTPLWIDSEGNELEAEYEETDGGFKVKVKSGLTLVFKA